MNSIRVSLAAVLLGLLVFPPTTVPAQNQSGSRRLHQGFWRWHIRRRDKREASIQL